MEFDLVGPLFAMDLHCTLVLGAMLIIVSLGRDAWTGFSGRG